VPPEAKAIAARVHHPGDRRGVDESAGQRGVDHRPDSVARAQQERAKNDDGRSCHRSQRGQRKVVKGVQDGGAVGGDAGDEHHGKQGVEEPDGERELLRRKVRGDQGKKAVGGESHKSRCGCQQEANPEHRTRKKLLGAVMAFAFPHADQGGHEGLVHRLGDKVDEQVGDEESREEGVHGVGAAIDPGDSEFLEGGDDFDEDSGSSDRCGGAENAAVDAAALEEPRELGSRYMLAESIASLQDWLGNFPQ